MEGLKSEVDYVIEAMVISAGNDLSSPQRKTTKRGRGGTDEASSQGVVDVFYSFFFQMRQVVQATGWQGAPGSKSMAQS